MVIKHAYLKRLNLLKKYPHYYSSKDTPELIEVEKAIFVSIHAKGSFTDKIFYDRIEALTRTAHAVKEPFENSDQAFDVSVLEGLYWYDEQKYGTIEISRIYDTFPFKRIGIPLDDPHAGIHYLPGYSKSKKSNRALT